MCKALRRTESNSSSVQVKYISIYHLQSQSPWACIYKFRLAASFENLLQELLQKLFKDWQNFFFLGF